MDQVTILGAGLVGSLLGILLRKKGYDVTIYERMADMRKETSGGGRSINLTISARGWKALELAGIAAQVEEIGIPLYGRCMHQQGGNRVFQPYSSNNDSIFSVSRAELNKVLLTMAEQTGVQLCFGHKCRHIDVPTNVLTLELPDGTKQQITAGLLFGADGAYSALREAYTRVSGVSSDKKMLEYGYKELTIVPGDHHQWLMDKNALHIWPRGNYMMVGQPNKNGSFTCSLFLPFEGPVSFESLDEEENINAFFAGSFGDVTHLMPGLAAEFKANPVGSLVTTHISRWQYKGMSALIGDAAHAIVPFYGQGMNAGFEDCSVLYDLVEKHNGDWEQTLAEYETVRRPDGDAVAELALHNFTEIRDKVAAPQFLVRKQVEKELNRRYPRQFSSVYEMVSFTQVSYRTAMRCIDGQDKLLGRIMGQGDFFENIKDPRFVQKLDKWVDEYYARVQEPCKPVARQKEISQLFPVFRFYEPACSRRIA